MDRETVAKFLTAERKITPLAAASFLIVAGIIAGSLNLVAPEQGAQYAAVSATDPYQSSAPKDCTTAIQAALGKQQGPQVSDTIGNMQSGTLDKCYGAVLKPGKQPSQKPDDYQCVGRSGTVTFYEGKAVATTIPDQTQQPDKCSVKVCTVSGETVTCSTPKQMAGGQSVPPPSGGGGTPSLPTPPPSGSGSGSGSTSGTPQPNTPEGTNTPCSPGTPGCSQTTPTSGCPAGVGSVTCPPTTNTSDQLNQLGGCPGAPGCPGYTAVNPSTNPNVSNNPGATVPGGETANLSPSAASNPYLNGTTPANSSAVNDPNSPTPTQTSTFGSETRDLAKDAGIDDIGKPEAPTRGLQMLGFPDPSGLDTSYMRPNPDALEPAVQQQTGDWTGGSSCERGGTCPGDDRQLPAENTTPLTGRESEIVASSRNPDAVAGDDRFKPAADASANTNDNGINTQIDCNGKTCSAYPANQQEIDALKKDGFTCQTYEGGTGACTRDYAPVTTPPPATPTTCKSESCVGGQLGDDRTKPAQPATQTPPPNNPGGNTPGGNTQNPGGATQSPGGGGGSGSPSSGGGQKSGSSPLTSFLGGLLKGLGSGLGQPQPQQQPAQQCPTDQNAYAQYQQQYNQQLQQYNYQLQQYNYQQQVNASYGYTNYNPPPPAPTPCTQGTGTPGANQCPSLAAQPDAGTCPLGTWRTMPSTVGSVVCPVWQCVPNNNSTPVPTAQITCSPDVAAEGTQININYSCTNASSTTGYGFVTGGAVSGATSTIVTAPPSDATAMNFAVRCENGSLNAAAQCSVPLARISITLQAQPNPVRSGDAALIGWVTTGMKSCTVSSSGDEAFTQRNASRTLTTGIATTSPLTRSTDYAIDCTTVTGQTRHQSVTVGVLQPGTVTASIEGNNSVLHGQNATIRWNFPSAPDVSAVALWLYSIDDQKTVALIESHRAKSGTFSWTIPASGADCDTSSSFVCAGDLIAGKRYEIDAALYTPPNAGLGETADPNLPQPTYLDVVSSGGFTVGD